MTRRRVGDLRRARPGSACGSMRAPTPPVGPHRRGRIGGGGGGRRGGRGGLHRRRNQSLPRRRRRRWLTAPAPNAVLQFAPAAENVPPGQAGAEQAWAISSQDWTHLRVSRTRCARRPATCAPAAAASTCTSSPAGQLYRGQPRPPGQQGRALRQGRRRASCRSPPRRGCARRCAASARAARARSRRSAGTRRSASPSHWLSPLRATRARKARLLHRPRPVAKLHRLLGAGVRHAELRRAWRLLLGQHGGRRHLHAWAAPSGNSASPTGTAPSFSSSSASPRTTTATRSRSASASSRRAAPRIIGVNPIRTGYNARRRRLDRHHPGHRRPADPGAGPRAADRRARSTSTTSRAGPTRPASSTRPRAPDKGLLLRDDARPARW